MKEVKTDIYKSLKRNNLIVWSVVVSCTLITCYSIWSANQARKEADRYLYGISNDGDLIPLEQLERKESFEIFKQSHVEMFMKNFYEFDQWNYKKNIERSLWLIDSEVGNSLYTYYQQQGHYNRMIQSTSSQSVTEVQVLIDPNNNFLVSAVIEINKPNQDVGTRYLFKGKGLLKEVSQNYPLNPYGYLIANFTETSNTKINE